MTATTVRIWAVTGLMAMLGTGTLRAGIVPRYELRPGQVLAYEEQQNVKGQPRDSGYRRPGGSGWSGGMTTGAGGSSPARR
jgi:hypothetical protein